MKEINWEREWKGGMGIREEEEEEEGGDEAAQL
jgi:hypothetical protein